MSNINKVVAKAINLSERLVLESGRYRVEFDYWEDGLRGGIYDPDDPEDRPVHRLTVYERPSNEWVMKCSHATRLSLFSSRRVLLGYLVKIEELVNAHPRACERLLAGMGILNSEAAESAEGVVA